jgi:SAM-dependent methyltransferase
MPLNLILKTLNLRKMMNSSNMKIEYLKVKNVSDKLTADRIYSGQRELQTLKLLSQEVGFSTGSPLTLLDLGCADKYLEPATKLEDWFYNGLDYTDVDFEIGRLPIESNSIDVIVSLAVIEHIRDPENFISEILRCLKPGGLIYLSTPNFQLDYKNFYNDPTHVRPYTPISLKELLKLNGFTSVETFPGLRCKNISWYRGSTRFLRAFYLLPFRSDTRFPVPSFLKGHARSVFGLGLKPINSLHKDEQLN